MVEKNNLQDHLEAIENQLGGNTKPLKDLGEHLEYIEELLGEGGTSAVSAHTKATFTAQYDGNELKLMMYLLSNESEFYTMINQGYANINQTFGTLLNTNCSSGQDIAANLNTLQQIDTTGGSDPDYNALVFTVLGFLLRDQSCIKVTMPFTGEFGTDTNSVDLIRTNNANVGIGLAYLNSSNQVVSLDISAFIGHTGVTYGATIESIGSSTSGSQESSSTESAYDYIQMCFDNSNDSHLILMFDKTMVRTNEVKLGVNNLITTLNTLGSINIPIYNDLEDLEDIADYLMTLDTNTYGTIKVIFWSSVFSVYPYLALSVKGYTNGAVVPVWFDGVADQDNDSYAFTVKFMNSSGQLETVASQQTTFDFDIFVNQLD